MEQDRNFGGKEQPHVYWKGPYCQGKTPNAGRQAAGRYLRRSQKALDFVAKINVQGKLTAAICHAGWVLISAKILKGKKATSYYAIRDDMENAGVVFVDESAVVDGNLITSRSPADLPDFLKAILHFLGEN